MKFRRSYYPFICSLLVVLLSNVSSFGQSDSIRLKEKAGEILNLIANNPSKNTVAEVVNVSAYVACLKSQNDSELSQFADIIDNEPESFLRKFSEQFEKLASSYNKNRLDDFSVQLRFDTISEGTVNEYLVKFLLLKDDKSKCFGLSVSEWQGELFLSEPPLSSFFVNCIVQVDYPILPE